jgi:hypothetical protein
VPPVRLAGAAEVLDGIAGAGASIHREIGEIREVFYGKTRFLSPCDSTKRKLPELLISL